MADGPADGGLAFLVGGGHMGALMRGHDWSGSPLGPPRDWPQALRAAVGLMLQSRFPMFVAWGDALGFLYNDSYAAILGAKHPRALGRRFHDIWAEIWPDISPLIDAAMAGEATWREDLPLLMNRRGFDEATWFTFSYSPVRDESGRVAGLFCACTETTRQVLAERRAVSERDRLAAMFEQAPGFICMLRGPDHVFELANAAHRRLFHSDDWIGRPVREAFPEIAGQGFFELLDRVYATGERYIASATPIRYRRAGDGTIEERRLDLVFAPVRDVDGQVTGIFCEGQDVTDQLRAEAALRSSEARLRALVTASADGVYRMSGDWRHMLELEGQGFLPDAADPSDGWLERSIPAEDRPAVTRAIRDAIATRSLFELEHRVRRIDGSLGWTLSRAVPLLDAEGGIAEWFGMASDVTARRAAADRLEESEATLRAFYDNAPVHMGLVEPTGDGDNEHLFDNPLSCAWYGVAPGGTAGKRSIADLGTDPAIVAAWLARYDESARTGRPVRFELQHGRGPAGRWLSATVARIGSGPSGRPRFCYVAEDVTARKAAEARQRLLTDELDHRVKNTLTIVQSIAMQTLRDTPDPQAFKDAFTARLMTLSRAHNLLTREAWAGAPLADIVAEALSPFRDPDPGPGAAPRIVAGGPAVTLAPAAAVTLSMALHELATNAAKYGALSGAAGGVALSWSRRPDPTSPAGARLAIEWREHDGPSVAPPQRRGFGRRLIEASARQLDGSAELSFPPAGAICRIELPLGGDAAA